MSAGHLLAERFAECPDTVFGEVVHAGPEAWYATCDRRDVDQVSDVAWSVGCSCEQVWQAFGPIANYVEAFAGSAAMLLGAPEGKRVETINDADGFVSNFWRAIAQDAEAVAHHADFVGVGDYFL